MNHSQIALLSQAQGGGVVLPAWSWELGLGVPGSGGLSLAGKLAGVLARPPGPSFLPSACCSLSSPISMQNSPAAARLS